MFPYTRQTIKSRIFVCIALIASFAAWPLNESLAQSRGKRTAASSALPAVPEGGGELSSDKLDVSDLEKKYWAAKDTDFSVVQNRTYSKVNRFSISTQYGMMLNDPAYEAPALSMSGSYYFSERYGVELNFTRFMPQKNKATEFFISRYATVIDHGEMKSFYGASFNWVPIYAKVSLLNSKIVYFDMAFSPGVGVTQYDAQVTTGNVAKTAPTLTFDISQQFFLGKHFVLRFDYKTRWFNEDVLYFSKTETDGTVLTGQKVKTDLTQRSFFMAGITFFY